MGAQATCGQFASDVQFVLRRTGPSLTGRPSSDSCPPPERCPIRASLPSKPRPALGRESHKGLTFGLGCPRLASSAALPEPVASVAPMPGCCEDLQGLERRVQRNAAELGQEAFWEQELQREQAREREGQARLQALSAATAEHAARLQALDAQARALEAKLQLATEGPGPPFALSICHRAPAPGPGCPGTAECGGAGQPGPGEQGSGGRRAGPPGELTGLAALPRWDLGVGLRGRLGRVLQPMAVPPEGPMCPRPRPRS